MAGKTTDMLTKAATEFAAAKAGDLISNLGDKMSGGGGSDKSKGDKSKDDNGGDDNKGFIGTAAQSLGEGKGPIKSLVSGAGAAIKGIFKRKGGSKRPHNIIEDCFVGVTPDGTITFTAIGENATLILFALEYRNKGPIEWIGNRWRTVGRRVRLDIKHFRRYVMRTEPEELPEPEEADEIPEDAKADDQDQDQSDEQSEGEGEEQGDDQADDQAEEPEDQAGDDSGDEPDQEAEDGSEEPADDSADEPAEDDSAAEEPDEEPAAKSARRPMPARRR
jgi:hypothetical protein